MQNISTLSEVALFWFMAVIVPGLDFLLITRLAVSQGRLVAWRASLGVSLGVVLWGLAGFFGIRALFMAAPWLYLALKIGGGLYLLITGARLFCASFQRYKQDDDIMHDGRARQRAFRAGIMTNLANPKAPVFVSSLFAAILPHHASMTLGLSCVALMFSVSIMWFGFVTIILSITYVNKIFLQFRQWVDRCAGLTFMVLGVHFATGRTSG